ncbi:MAG: hypothetical protein WBV82_13740 [Myxococcaceae bacterium]
MADREPKTKTPGTYADIEALPPGWVGEILDGTFYGHPRPATGHSRVETTHAGGEDIQVQPFDAVPLEMGLLWLDPH